MSRRQRVPPNASTYHYRLRLLEARTPGVPTFLRRIPVPRRPLRTSGAPGSVIQEGRHIPTLLDDDQECERAQKSSHAFWPPSGTSLSAAYLRAWFVLAEADAVPVSDPLTTERLSYPAGHPLFSLVVVPSHVSADRCASVVRGRTDRHLADSGAGAGEFREAWSRVAAHLTEGSGPVCTLTGAWWELAAACDYRRGSAFWMRRAVQSVWPPYADADANANSKDRPPAPGWNRETAKAVCDFCRQCLSDLRLARCLALATLLGADVEAKSEFDSDPPATRRRVLEMLGVHAV